MSTCMTTLNSYTLHTTSQFMTLTVRATIIRNLTTILRYFYYFAFSPKRLILPKICQVGAVLTRKFICSYV